MYFILVYLIWVVIVFILWFICTLFTRDTPLQDPKSYLGKCIKDSSLLGYMCKFGEDIDSPKKIKSRIHFSIVMSIIPPFGIVALIYILIHALVLYTYRKVTPTICDLLFNVVQNIKKIKITINKEDLS